MLSPRPMLNFDAPYVTDIEIKSYPKPWLFKQFMADHRSVVGITDGKVVCYYCIQGYQLLRFAVHPSWRKCGVGTTLMEHVKRMHKVTIIVPESDEGAQLFLRSTGFQCVNVLEKTFNDLGNWEAGYFFLWKKTWESKPLET